MSKVESVMNNNSVEDLDLNVQKKNDVNNFDLSEYDTNEKVLDRFKKIKTLIISLVREHEFLLKIYKMQHFETEMPVRNINDYINPLLVNRVKNAKLAAECNIKIAELSYAFYIDTLKFFFRDENINVLFISNKNLPDDNKTSKPEQPNHGFLYTSPFFAEIVYLALSKIDVEYSKNRITILYQSSLTNN